MKKTLLVLGAIVAAIYFGMKALWQVAWRLGLLVCLISPAVMAFYLAYAINVLHWQIATLWTMPPLILVSILVGQREFSWTEPLVKPKTR